MARPSKRTALVGVLAALAALHLLAVTFAALPPNGYSAAVNPHTTYLQPYFAQNWRLFAPSPVAQDREVLLQGSYVDASGEPQQTEWINWTEVELDLIRHRLVGGRAGYVTNKLYTPLAQRYRGIGSAQRTVADQTAQDAPPSWTELRRQLESGGADRDRVATFLTYERSVARLATDVLMGRWPDRQLTAVRYRLRSQAVVPYAKRSGTDTQREADRPDVTERTSGWRVPTPGTADERKAVAAFDRRHR